MNENHFPNARFPNGHLLAGTAWLADHLQDPQMVLVEVTPPGSGYVFSHLPGARYLNLNDVFTGRGQAFPHGMGLADEVAAVLGGLGITPEKQIVIYDEIGGQRAAKTLWLLECLGFERVAVLEGGMERWLAEGRATTRIKPKLEPSTFIPALQAERQATADWILAHLNRPGTILIDCRTHDEFAEGHIPGAHLRPWDQSLTLLAYQAFKNANELQAEFDQLGASHGKEVVVYCATGFRAAHLYLTFRLLGYPNVRNYEGSWTEWSAREDLPKA